MKVPRSLVSIAVALAALAQGSACRAEDSTEQHAAKRPRICLVLGGGGTRGAAQVGVLRVFEREKIPIDCIVGTSIGSIVGGLYSAGVTVPDLEEKFTNGKLMRSFMTMPLAVRLVLSPILLMPRVVYHPYDGLFAGHHFRRYLVKSVPESNQQIENLKIPYRAVALSLVTGKPNALSSGNLAYAMQASSAVPSLRKPIQIGNDLFVDGGVAANLPVKIARAEFKPDILIAVDVDERLNESSLESFRKIGSVARRTIKLQLAIIDDPQAKDADVLIHPDVDDIGLTSTRIKDAKRALASGEIAAEKAIPEIKKKIAEFDTMEAKLP